MNGDVRVPAKSTIHAVLDRHGLVKPMGPPRRHATGTHLSLGQAPNDQRVGLKEVEDGIWLVSFMHYDLGYIDLEQRTLQPIDTPFG